MKITCPNCNSTNTCRIMYGLPDFTEKLEQDLETGRVYLGGCIISDDDPDRHCSDCNLDFNTKQQSQPT